MSNQEHVNLLNLSWQALKLNWMVDELDEKLTKFSFALKLCAESF